MNQILVTEKKEKKKKITAKRTIEIAGIVRFFAVIIIMYGLIMAGQGSYAMYRNIEDRKPANIPTVTIGRVNDKAIVYVEHNVEISKITYFWDNGEEMVIPIGSTSAQEEIALLGYDSVLNLEIEDINGKQVTYQKQYLLGDKDIAKPTIDIQTANGSNKMTITATDETEIAYLSYRWDGEQEVIIDSTEEGQKEIKHEIELKPGTKKIKITAEDVNGNIEIIEKDIIASSARPEMTINKNKGEITITAKDKDGIKNIFVNLNGQRYGIEGINLKEVTVGTLYLREGNNTISIEVTNVSGYTEVATTEIQYIP